jgi:hypothetical protein
MNTRVGDPGFFLGVLEQAMQIDADTREAVRELFAKTDAVEQGDDAFEAEGNAVSALVQTLQNTVKIPDDILAKIESIHFDGGNDVYMDLEAALEIETGGESDHYIVASIEGVQKLTSLRTLSFDSYGFNEKGIDLSPLAKHPSVESLDLTVHSNFEILTTMPKLKKVQYSQHHSVAFSEETKATLVQRGVQVVAS